MRMSELKDDVYNWTCFLSELDCPNLDELLNLSGTLRRVRNVTPFFAMFYEKEKWNELCKNSEQVKEMNHYFQVALAKLKNSSETKEVASSFEKEVHLKSKVVVVKEKQGPSSEMAKFFTSLVRERRLEATITEKENLYVENLLKNVDLNNLFVEKNNHTISDSEVSH